VKEEKKKLFDLVNRVFKVPQLMEASQKLIASGVQALKLGMLLILKKVKCRQPIGPTELNGDLNG